MFYILFLLLIFRQISSIEFSEFGEGAVEAFFSQAKNNEPAGEVLLINDNDDIDDYGNTEETVILEEFGTDAEESLEEGTVEWKDEALNLEEGTVEWKDEALNLEEGTVEWKDEALNLEEGTVEWGDEAIGAAQTNDDDAEQRGKDGNCAKGWLNFRDEACFYGLGAQKDFYSGIEECGHLKANFTSIHSVEEFKFIISHWNLRDFWIGIFYGKSQFEDGTEVDEEMLQQIAPFIPWARPNSVKGFICRKDPMVRESKKQREDTKILDIQNIIEQELLWDKTANSEDIIGDKKSEINLEEILEKNDQRDNRTNENEQRHNWTNENDQMDNRTNENDQMDNRTNENGANKELDNRTTGAKTKTTNSESLTIEYSETVVAADAREGETTQNEDESARGGYKRTAEGAEQNSVAPSKKVLLPLIILPLIALLFC